MKRLFFILFTALAVVAASADAFGQARINTKKHKIADITTHTTKIVLGGNEMTDAALKSEVTARWRVSPYEFCDADEYRRIKEDPDYYFLIIARSDERKYDGILTLTLIKGGKPGAEDPQKRPVEVASLPLSASGFPSGREITYLPALLDILQDFVTKAVLSDRVGYAGFDVYAGNIRRIGHKRVFMSEDDVVPDLDEVTKRKCFGEDFVLTDEDSVDNEFLNSSYNTLVSYVVAPFDPRNGSWCYKMLIDAETHELYWFGHHRISPRKWAGFLAKDIKSISARI